MTFCLSAPGHRHLDTATVFIRSFKLLYIQILNRVNTQSVAYRAKVPPGVKKLHFYHKNFWWPYFYFFASFCVRLTFLPHPFRQCSSSLNVLLGVSRPHCPPPSVRHCTQYMTIKTWSHSNSKTWTGHNKSLVEINGQNWLNGNEQTIKYQSLITVEWQLRDQWLIRY